MPSVYAVTLFCMYPLQVLSKSVADAFQYYGNLETAETERFIRFVDRFFDCLNVRSVSEWITKLKPDRKPYCSPDDERMKVCCTKVLFSWLQCGTIQLPNGSLLYVQWLKDVFVKYLKDWENSAKGLCKGTDVGYHYFTLSQATLEGIYITGMCTQNKGKYNYHYFFLQWSRS